MEYEEKEDLKPDGGIVVTTIRERKDYLEIWHRTGIHGKGS